MAFVGHVNGSTYRKGINIKYQSMVDGELVYEYQIKQMLKNSKSSFSNGSNVVRLNDLDFVFLMEDKGIEILRKAKYWKFDGTYEKKPKEYSQVYTIVAVFCEYPAWQKSYTTGIVFVKTKDTASYETLFKKLKELIGDDVDMADKEFGFDHEMAAINAAKAVFPESKIVLCFWHCPKNLQDYARSKKCSSHLADDINFQKWLRRIIGSTTSISTMLSTISSYLSFLICHLYFFLVFYCC